MPTLFSNFVHLRPRESKKKKKEKQTKSLEKIEDFNLEKLFNEEEDEFILGGLFD